ncbi:MAG: sensor histidine kinase [Methanobacterium sp.]
MLSNEDNWNSLREKIIGLGERSVHKSYYPELQQQMKELKRFRTLLDHTNDAIFLLDIYSGMIVDINSSVLKQLGYSREEALKMPIEKFILGSFDEIKIILQNLKNNKNDLNKHNLSTFILKSNGEKIPVEISISAVEFNDDLYAVIVARDITERNEAQEALKESEQKYKVLFESSIDYIALIDLEGKIIDINKPIRYITDIPKEELIGKTFTEIGLIPKNIENYYRDKFKETIKTNSSKSFEMALTDVNNQNRFLEVSTSLLKRDKNNVAIQLIAHDITERKKAEKQIKSSLKEKEVLLKEIHHRVKNNLQIISSLLNLQSASVEDKDAFEVFKESQNRIKSMALIHEKLYQSEDLTRIDFAEYIKSLVFHLFRSYSVDSSTVNPIINVEDVLFDIDISIPCGLIINEVVSNSLKYAFPKPKLTKSLDELLETQKNEIKIDLHLKEEKAVLILSDNGIGLPDDIDLNNTKTLGLRLVNLLVNQINGKMKVDNINGTEFKIEFEKI